MRGYVSAIEGLRERSGVVLGLCAILTILLGLVAFPLEAAARGEQVSLLESLYGTLGLFAFAGNRFGFPQTFLLGVVYFGAPLVAASALVEAALRMAVDGSSFLLVGLRGHSVVGGMGNVGSIIASHLDHEGQMQVLIDWRPDSRTVGERGGARSLGPHVLIIGDMTGEEVLRRARAQHAAQVFFAAADDLANIEAAACVRAMSPRGGGASPKVFCHVYDEALREGLSEERSGVRYFNSYGLAAKALVARLFWDHWMPSVQMDSRCHLVGTAGAFSLVAQAPQPPLYVVVGLGRFGLSVLQQLVDAAPVGARVLAVDRDGARVDAAMDSLPPALALAVERRVMDAMQGDWIDIIPNAERSAVMLFCTDNDRANLAMAMRAAKGGHRTMSRMFDQDTWTHLGDSYGDHRNLGVALFRELFWNAIPLLTHQGYVAATEGDSPSGSKTERIRTCLRLPGGEEHWYLTRLDPAESRRMAVPGEAIRVADLPWQGEAAELPAAHWWLLTRAGLERALGAHLQSGTPAGRSELISQ